MKPKLSVLDLVFVGADQDLKTTFDNTVEVAQALDELGYNRLWVAEHHNMKAIASAATSVVIGHLASKTKNIRVGAGGIMLPNHSPLTIAEQFGTLNALYPGRIDLGLGRAPGTDQKTLRALRTDAKSSESFPSDVVELQHFLSKESANDPIVATPGVGQEVPLWILGSSTFGAQLAAHLGLPYAFASHFAPDAIREAVRLYRENFAPSAQAQSPYLMLGVNIIIAETDEKAHYLATSQQQSFVNLRRGTRNHFPAPIENIEDYWSSAEKFMAQHMLKYSFIGSPSTVKAKLTAFCEDFNPDELMVVSAIYDKEERIKSLTYLREIIS
jgi:luciferase family oxidoreductase group 1